MEACEDLACRFVAHGGNHRVGIGSGGVAFRGVVRIRVRKLDAAPASDLRSGGHDGAIVRDVIGDGFCGVGADGFAFFVRVGTRIALRSRETLGLQVDEGIDAFDFSTAPVFHKTHALESPLIHRIADVCSIDELVVALTGKKLE